MSVRTRFAPSPTGPLHIGGLRTALFCYLFAKNNGGDFVLRIEDTDQNRFVKGAENYILEALKWCGIEPNEGAGIGGEYGPYKQSERKAMYKQYAERMITEENAYYAFDTSEEIEAMRNAQEAKGENPQYNSKSRMSMKNSLTLSDEEVQTKLNAGEDYVIRTKMPEDEVVSFTDIVREEVKFNTNQLDDKILLKSDGMPTYHMANVVDDYLMKITHVVRGEEWLPSTPTHVLLYRFLGWADSMPTFAHLPLILKPTGKGKLSKRDGDKGGFPVFPIDWLNKETEETFSGFREKGFLAEAFLNYLVFLGWNPGTEQEIFTKEGLEQVFTLEKVSKSPARFDFEKAKWFNQQYLMKLDNETILSELKQFDLPELGQKEDEYLLKVIEQMKSRVELLPELVTTCDYYFSAPKEYEEKQVRKKWKLENEPTFNELLKEYENLNDFTADIIEQTAKDFMEKVGWGFGQVLPFLRIGVTGIMSGPSIFDSMELIGKEETLNRMKNAVIKFNEIAHAKIQKQTQG